MSNGKVYTKTKDRVLVDKVYESPVDQSELRFRRKFGLIAAGILILLMLLTIM